MALSKITVDNAGFFGYSSKKGVAVEDDYYEDPTYTHILVDIMGLREESEQFTQERMMEEISGIHYHIKGKDSEKVQHLIFKDYADQKLDKDEMEFLKNIYVIYYCHYALVVDEPEDDDEI